MKNQGSLGYQMMNVLKTIFHPGRSRYEDKKYQRDPEVIRGIGTMRSMSADVHQFARFIRSAWPEVKVLKSVTPEMAQAYISELVRRENSGGHIGRVCATIRKLDIACRKAGTFSTDQPALLPHKSEGGPGGFHSESRTNAYTSEQARQIIARIAPDDPAVARLLSLMLVAGLRVTEACYLRAQDIDLGSKTISLNSSNNANRTKGGRPRVIHYPEEQHELITELKTLGEKNPTGHILKDRGSLPDRAREEVRKACQAMAITCLGTHGFRKTFAKGIYQKNREGGQNDPEALLETARELGHNRAEVTRQSYVSVYERKRDAEETE